MKESTALLALTLAHQIRNSLVSRIASGDLQPGERLIETQLAISYGTSQAPVRDALRELEAVGMVETRPRRGTFVGPFVEQTLRESYVVRAALEETATRLCMLGGILPLADLHSDVDDMWVAAGNDDAAASLAASISFHRHIIHAAQNELLERSWESLQIEARTSVTMVAANVEAEGIARDHESLLRTIESGDIDAACKLARDHQWNYAKLPHKAHGLNRLSAG